MRLPVSYDTLTRASKKRVREHYIDDQEGLCYWCKANLYGPPPKELADTPINWNLFPGGKDFLKYPIHLQHDHDTGLTEGAVHAFCNAYMWEYHGR